jgi:hypothetical protein
MTISYGHGILVNAIQLLTGVAPRQSRRCASRPCQREPG